MKGGIADAAAEGGIADAAAVDTPDFGPARLHPIMSITKTTLNLMLGGAVANGLVHLDARVGTYLPEIGSGYAEATVKAVADMNVANDFSEDMSDPYTSAFDMEAATGWRLPLEGQKEGTTRLHLRHHRR
ncbi:hypothetical protein [Mesorhizobium sp. M1348]|uniref:hypothetical protein n=1 Tax=Mesorhizobium sp. M1348 TaxID=2957089 RepID=UPI00333AD1AE